MTIETQRISAAAGELITALQALSSMAPSIDIVGGVLVDALRNGNKILTCGNGGSAADALHMAEELMGRYKISRRALPAIALAADPTLLTCIANDFGYESVFSRQIEAIAQPNDIVVAFTSSGNSPNLLRALDAAKRKSALSVALLGKKGGAMAGRADYEIIIPSNETARIQEIHTFLLHCWLERIDSVFVN